VSEADALDLPPDDIDDAEAADRLAALQKLMDLMRPAVQADGGDLVLVHADVRTGQIEVQLRGSCSSCAISGATLQQGVERLLRDRLDWVRSVEGSVEEVDDLEASAALGRGAWQPADD
jgi:Fe-S cluster biogenesis protein NfuA